MYIIKKTNIYNITISISFSRNYNKFYYYIISSMGLYTLILVWQTLRQLELIKRLLLLYLIKNNPKLALIIRDIIVITLVAIVTIVSIFYFVILFLLLPFFLSLLFYLYNRLITFLLVLSIFLLQTFYIVFIIIINYFKWLDLFLI